MKNNFETTSGGTICLSLYELLVKSPLGSWNHYPLIGTLRSPNLLGPPMR